MNQDTLSEFYDEDNFSGQISRIKFLLMPFVFFALIGFPRSIAGAEYITSISNFAALAFFIFSGFFTLAPNREIRMRKLGSAIKRSLVFFLIMLVGYFALNVAYLAYSGSLDQLLAPETWRKRAFFEFFVLNVWRLPVGSSIWFIQSLLYAYVFFYITEKLKLSRVVFSVPFLILLLAFMLVSGELAGLFRIMYFGYLPYIPGGFLTKALPFMLIGMFLRKHIDDLIPVPRFVFGITFVLGILCAVGERYLLQSTGNLIYKSNSIGCAIMAVSVCCFAVTWPEASPSFLCAHGGNYARRMYALCQPSHMIIWLVCKLAGEKTLSMVRDFGAIVCLAVCVILAFVIGWFKFHISLRVQKPE